VSTVGLIVRITSALENRRG